MHWKASALVKDSSLRRWENLIMRKSCLSLKIVGLASAVFFRDKKKVTELPIAFR
jgi:hypothetical protein